VGLGPPCGTCAVSGTGITGGSGTSETDV